VTLVVVSPVELVSVFHKFYGLISPAFHLAVSFKLLDGGDLVRLDLDSPVSPATLATRGAREVLVFRKEKRYVVVRRDLHHHQDPLTSSSA
jgi:hypothetical protein